MIAAKQFDPVVGIDIHIIQPPGPVPPVPVPHPFIGILLDPFDFAPIIGGTVMVNGIPRATAGTGGKCIPPHIPIGGVFVKPPGNECEVFMGSSTVLADGEPLSFLGMPALSCHDIGMPPPPRLKKKKVPKSLFLPTSVVLSVPAGAPVLVGGPPTVSMMALGMKAAMAGLGKAFKKLRKLQKASRRMKALSDKVHKAAKKAMDKLGVPPSVQNRVHRAVCTVTGHPVDVATGKVFTEAVDFELAGPIPFRWERVWYSCSEYQGPLGHGWHHCYDIALIEEDGIVAVRMADGRAVAFPALAIGQDAFDAKEQLQLFRDHFGYRLRDRLNLVYRFQSSRTGTISRLVSIEDANGNRIDFSHNSAGQLIGIVDSSGRHIAFERDAQGRVGSVLLPHPLQRGQTIRAVAYRYDDAGELVESQDAEGFTRRYRYSGHILIQETDRNGYSFHFAYDGHHPNARCISTWGDGEFYSRQLTYNDAARETVVLDSRKAATRFAHNDLGLVTRETDARGDVTLYEWDEDGRKVAETDKTGSVRAYEYDEFGRLVAASGPGPAFRLQRDSAGNAVVYTNAAGSIWRREFDRRGNLIATHDPLGNSWSFQVDSQGLLHAARDPQGMTTIYERNDQGNLVMIIEPSGRAIHLRHDALGRPIECVRDTRHRTILEWDLSGSLTAVHSSTGNSHRIICDGEGNAVAYQDGSGVRRYEYGPRGMLLASHEPSGLTTRYDYDAEAVIVGAFDNADRSWQMKRDALGLLSSSTDSTSRTRRYEYNAQGRLVTYGDDSERQVVLEYGPGGSLKTRRYRDGTEERFVYDVAGRLMSAVNDVCTVTFEYDAAGRLIAEASDFGSQRVAYDVSGRLSEVIDDRSTIHFEHDADGRLGGVHGAGKQLLTVSREKAGRETIYRFFNDVERREVRDGGGALLSSRVDAGDRELLHREFALDGLGRVTAVRDRDLGVIRYERNADGTLLRSLDSGGEDQYSPISVEERAGKTVLSVDLEKWTRAGLVRLDPAGNVVQKSGSGAWLYDYDAAGRLVSATSPSGVSVEFRYDALGRRIEKRSGSTIIRYAWFGELLYAETRIGPTDRATIRYVWEPSTFRPIAALTGGRVTFFHCDTIGTPWAATDESGTVIWSGLMGASGAIRIQRGNSGLVPFRFPGQFEDTETGLYYNRFRYYDPQMRMYLSPDPIGLVGGLGIYDYVPDPLTWTDPYGLAARRVCTTPDCPNCAKPGDTLVRRGGGAETAQSLKDQAVRAEKAGFPHGVSVTTPQTHARRAQELGYDPEDASRATKEAFEEAGFPVHHTPTKPDPTHHTVELPQDVTEEAAEKFNSVLGRT